MADSKHSNLPKGTFRIDGAEMDIFFNKTRKFFDQNVDFMRQASEMSACILGYWKDNGIDLLELGGYHIRKDSLKCVSKNELYFQLSFIGGEIMTLSTIEHFPQYRKVIW